MIGEKIKSVSVIGEQIKSMSVIGEKIKFNENLEYTLYLHRYES